MKYFRMQYSPNDDLTTSKIGANLCCCRQLVVIKLNLETAKLIVIQYACEYI